ncbi:caspase family protein [Mesobacterium sp. TK19101]|uniref:Caspase family protein n=1 Tax=Mesobacterium hydrothermale TaxID=3111907 RepID=A0ABU6HB92_9RHOB|nr:caspase family protein [Mesobacterium sp. TK19101]MEC3859713.1 caspase family protein [Mesobacterium sp. TK19101]
MLVRLVWVLLALTLGQVASAADRVALVIGNSAYQNASRLANPANDSRAIADKLTSLGFDVTLQEDLNGQGMRMALGQFAESALRADVALVFYAGHGIEMSGRNYLIPVDAQMRSEATAQFEALALDDVISAVNQAGRLGIVMLDACRDNPFASAMQRNSGTRSMSRGLAPISVEGQDGLVVSFAAQEGSTAADGDGQHSPYTAALLQVLDEPGLEVGRVFRKVRAQVREATGGGQVPVERTQLPDEAIYFVPPGSTVAVMPGVAPAPAATVLVADPMTVYLSAVQSGQPDPLANFIAAYPDHPRADDARALLLSLQDDAYWTQVKSDGSESALRRYLIAFPDGHHQAEAEMRLAALAPPKAPAVPAQPTPLPPQTQRGDGAAPSLGRASFDCGKAQTTVELAICGNATLADQDGTLGQAYKTALSRGYVTRAEQVLWLKLRETVCAGVG